MFLVIKRLGNGALHLRSHQLYVKLSKCAFAETEVEFSGHIVLGEGVMTDPAKVAAIVQWPRPMVVKELRGFLSLTRYHRKFIRHYGLISGPLTELLKKDAF